MDFQNCLMAQLPYGLWLNAQWLNTQWLNCQRPYVYLFLSTLLSIVVYGDEKEKNDL
jgi:hypothetical protein